MTTPRIGREPKPRTALRTELSKQLGVGQLLAASAALTVACCILLAYQLISLRQTLADDVRVQAAIIADNVAAPLMFRDRDAAADMLRSFQAAAFLATATVHDAQGAVFAAYRNPAAGEAPALLRELPLFAPVTVERTVAYGGRTLGRVVLTADTQGIRRALLHYGALLVLASLGALVATSLVTRRARARMRLAEHQLEYLAYTDPVTELPNRRRTYEALAEAVGAGPGKNGRRVGLLLIDLDNFKVVNDTAGHAAGDQLLRQVAEVLRAAVRPSDRIGRIGGDEFAVVVSPLDGADELAAIAQRIVAGLRQPLQIDALEVTPTASIGASTYPDDARTMSELLSNADAALYRAKGNGRDNVALFEPGMILAAQRRARLDRDLRRHLDAGMLDVVYQPQYCCRTRTVIGVEALLRWPHPEGAISPAEFIPIAEESGLIVEVGKWVLERACRDAVTLQRLTGTWLGMAVNVSARQLRDNEFIRVVQDTLARTGMPPERLELELTESMLMQDPAEAIAFMHQVRALGVRLSIDDFGTGYSSLSYLQTFPIDHLKLDRSFVCLLPDSGTMIAGAVIGLAHGFGLTVIAEGVEEQAQLDWLREAGCDFVQGYLMARPLPFATLAEQVAAARVPAA